MENHLSFLTHMKEHHLHDMRNHEYQHDRCSYDVWRDPNLQQSMKIDQRFDTPLCGGAFDGFQKLGALLFIGQAVHLSAEFQSSLRQKRWQWFTANILPDQIRERKEMTAHSLVHQRSQLFVRFADCFELFSELSAATF